MASPVGKLVTPALRNSPDLRVDIGALKTTCIADAMSPTVKMRTGLVSVIRGIASLCYEILPFLLPTSLLKADDTLA